MKNFFGVLAVLSFVLVGCIGSVEDSDLNKSGKRLDDQVTSDLTKGSYLGGCWVRIAGPYIEYTSTYTYDKPWVCGGIVINNCNSDKNFVSVNILKNEVVEFSRNASLDANGYKEICTVAYNSVSEDSWTVDGTINDQQIVFHNGAAGLTKLFGSLNKYPYERYYNGDFPYDQVIAESPKDFQLAQDLTERYHYGNCSVRVAGPYLESDNQGQDWVCGGVVIEDCSLTDSSTNVIMNKVEVTLQKQGAMGDGYKSVRQDVVGRFGYLETCLVASEGIWEVVETSNNSTVVGPSRSLDDMFKYNPEQYQNGEFPYNGELVLNGQSTNDGNFDKNVPVNPQDPYQGNLGYVIKYPEGECQYPDYCCQVSVEWLSKFVYPYYGQDATYYRGQTVFSCNMERAADALPLKIFFKIYVQGSKDKCVKYTNSQGKLIEKNPEECVSTYVTFTSENLKKYGWVKTYNAIRSIYPDKKYFIEGRMEECKAITDSEGTITGSDCGCTFETKDGIQAWTCP